LLQYRAQGFSELMAYRFFVGIFEVIRETDRVKTLKLKGIDCILSEFALCIGSLVSWR
jgi:hypothetical protein